MGVNVRIQFLLVLSTCAFRLCFGRGCFLGCRSDPPRVETNVGLGQQCNISTNETRYNCIGQGVSVNCDEATGKCVCNAGYQPHKDGKTCLSINRPLNESCTRDQDCHTAFSFCNESKCECLEEFKAENGRCIPKDGYKCFNGGPPLQNPNGTGILECRQTYKGFSPTGDTCPENYTCSYHLQTVSSIDRRNVGHCCPSTAPSPPKIHKTIDCPVGDQLINATCPDYSNVPADGEYTGPPRTCPYYTHDCYRVSVCCRLPCRNVHNNYAIDGNCYSFAHQGQPCYVDAQCVEPAKKCVKDKDKDWKVCQ